MKNPAQLIDAFFRKPLLIEDATLRMILAALNASAAFPAPQAAYGSARAGSVITVRSEIAVIPVYGVLTYRSIGFFSYLFGDTTYQEIRNNFRQALGDNAVSAIVLDCATPGGGVEGTFDLVDEIYQSRGVKPIYAMINESAFSAGYLIASAAEKVFLPRTGLAGSVGTVMVHIDESAADEMAGMKYTEIYSGARKIDGNPHAPLSDETRAVYQKMVDQVGDLIIETVARNRGMKPADVRAQQAAIYTGKEAVAAGLADAVLSWDAAWKRIIGAKSIKGGTSMKAKLQALFDEAPNKETIVLALAELGYVPKMEGAVILPAGVVPALAAALGIDAAQLGGDLTKIDFTKLGMSAVAAAVSAAESKTRKETLAHVQSIHEICALGGMEKMFAGLIKAETKVEDARTQVLAAKAASAAGTQINSTIGGVGAEAPNLLLADAKKRAAAREARR